MSKYSIFIIFLLIVACNNNEKNAISNKINKQTQTKTTKTKKIFVADKSKNNCLSCHAEIAAIMDEDDGMMQSIYKLAGKAGYPDNDCIVCHGGNPDTKDKFAAHKGTTDFFKNKKGPKEFYPNPGSVWINKNTCGLCHKEQVSTQFTSLMFTEAGKIQGTTWGFGGLQGYEHNVANVAVNELNKDKILGSDVYKQYMENLRAAEPQVFPKKMKPLPKAPTAEEAAKNPSLAAYTYLRSECQRCHLGVKGQQKAGDFRGTGCSACHIPYSNRGLYEGKDKMINKQQPGKLLVHSIQSTQDTKVKLHGKTYSGIPTKTCTACHNRGRRIGVSYEGLMETSYRSPFMSDGGEQVQIHKKNYIHLQPDVHLKKGMLCQDCHTSGDLHGSGFLAGAISGAVEIECQDCHGTPDKYPWELPFGYGDEISEKNMDKQTYRGVALKVPDYLKMGWIADVADGYLLTSRGNPMPRVTRSGDSVLLYSASGKIIPLKPLKLLAKTNQLSIEGKIAMQQVGSHINKMECYTCHATWAPQCYGCHIKIDYSKLDPRKDWVKCARNHDKHGLTADENGNAELLNYVLTGDVKEQRSYLRWEDPPLVVNGEHRVSPAIPGCQTTVTVIGKDGKPVLLNHIFKIPNVEGAGTEGQNAIDMAPLHPHTVQKKARTCESCHTNPKAMGYGINEGKLYSSPNKNIVMDLTDVNGNPIAAQIDTQFNAIPNLKNDWSVILNSQGKQVQTVGHHFSGSRPLNKEELSKLDRRGVCLACHETIPDKDIATDLMSHIAHFAKVKIDKDEHSDILNKSIRLSAWTQVLGAVFVTLMVLFLIYKFIKRKKRNTDKET